MAWTPDPYLPSAGNPGYQVRRYELELDYRVASNRLTGRAQLLAVASAELSRLSLDLAGLRASKVSVDGRRSRRFSQRGQKLHVVLDRAIPASATFSVDVHYGGNPRPLHGPWGEVGFEELTDGVIVAGQPNGASSWFPCNDHPSNKATYRIAVTTDSPYTVLANGSLVERKVHASRTQWVYDQPAPMASYLATVQIGQYVLVDVSSRPVRQRAALPARLRKGFAHDFGRQERMMKVFTELFGPYPFDSYSVVVTNDRLEIPLEAQGLSVFGANHVDGRRGAERLVAHEMAHQWFGNSLTVARWQDIWLHEGFACYAEWLWSERSGGPSAAAHARRWWDRLASLPQDLVIADPGPSSMFDDRLYKRGALALHSVRTELGDKPFFAMLRDWTSTHRHGSVSTVEFLDHVGSQATGNVRTSLQAWLYDKELPDLP